jgi:hypothetical protein
MVSVQTYKASFVPIFRGVFTIGRLILAGVVIVVTIASARAQEATSSAETNRHQWHKYVNLQYGFSFSYPNTYKAVSPADTDGRCTETEYYKCLLWLAQRDDPETIIWIGISRQPFSLHPGSGDVMPIRQRIGHHVFYCGAVGSMGVGYSDFCILNLKGKALEFQFSPAEGVNSSGKTHPLVPRILKTFRTL